MFEWRRITRDGALVEGLKCKCGMPKRDEQDAGNARLATDRGSWAGDSGASHFLECEDTSSLWLHSEWVSGFENPASWFWNSAAKASSCRRTPYRFRRCSSRLALFFIRSWTRFLEFSLAKMRFARERR